MDTENIQSFGFSEEMIFYLWTTENNLFFFSNIQEKWSHQVTACYDHLFWLCVLFQPKFHQQWERYAELNTLFKSKRNKNKIPTQFILPTHAVYLFLFIFFAHAIVNESVKYCRNAWKLVAICHSKKHTVAASINSFFFFFSSVHIFSFLDGYSDIEARLVVRKYIEKGSSATLYCEHNVDPKILYKVSIWNVWFPHAMSSTVNCVAL